MVEFLLHNTIGAWWCSRHGLRFSAEQEPRKQEEGEGGENEPRMKHGSNTDKHRKQESFQPRMKHG